MALTKVVQWHRAIGAQWRDSNEEITWHEGQDGANRTHGAFSQLVGDRPSFHLQLHRPAGLAADTAFGGSTSSVSLCVLPSLRTLLSGAHDTTDVRGITDAFHLVCRDDRRVGLAHRRLPSGRPDQDRVVPSWNEQSGSVG